MKHPIYSYYDSIYTINAILLLSLLLLFIMHLMIMLLFRSLFSGVPCTWYTPAIIIFNFIVCRSTIRRSASIPRMSENAPHIADNNITNTRTTETMCNRVRARTGICDGRRVRSPSVFDGDRTSRWWKLTFFNLLTLRRRGVRHARCPAEDVIIGVYAKIISVRQNNNNNSNICINK